MRKQVTLLLSIFLSSLLAAGPAQAQKGDGKGWTHKRATHLQTLSGLVVSVSSATGGEGLRGPVYLTLETKQGKVKVLLGPSRYVEQQPLKIIPLDRIQVTGFKLEVQGKPVYFVASEINKGGQVMKLRDQEGRPLWGGAGIK